jgi:hypothetical protein
MSQHFRHAMWRLKAKLGKWWPALQTVVALFSAASLPVTAPEDKVVQFDHKH